MTVLSLGQHRPGRLPPRPNNREGSALGPKLTSRDVPHSEFITIRRAVFYGTIAIILHGGVDGT